MDGKVLSQSTISKLTDVLMKIVKVNFFLKPIVKTGIKRGLEWLNDKADKVIPDDVDKYFDNALNEGIKGNWDLAYSSSGKALALLTDLKNVEEEEEDDWYANALRAIIGFIKNKWIKKNLNY